jgi:N4-gp56 family major capsid protein
MANTTTTTLAADLQTYFSKRLLDINAKDQVLQTAAYKENIPSNASKTISFTQYSRLSVPGAVLTEGTTPTDTTVSNAAVTAVVDQWGAFVTLTDIAELTVKHPVVGELEMLLGEQANETIETQINTVLVAGTTVQYADAVANRAALGAANVMDTAELQKALKTLRVNGARPVSNGNFVLFVDPSVEQDLLADSTFKTAAQFGNVAKTGESYSGGAVLGTWFGIEVRRSNVIPTIASTTTVHTSYLVGRNAYAMTTLQNLETYVEAPGGNADPLHQRRTIGWKVAFKSVILNQNFMVRIESGSAFN